MVLALYTLSLLCCLLPTTPTLSTLLSHFSEGSEEESGLGHASRTIWILVACPCPNHCLKGQGRAKEEKQEEKWDRNWSMSLMVIDRSPSFKNPTTSTNSVKYIFCRPSKCSTLTHAAFLS